MRAFTLIECLVYLGLFGIVMSAALVGFSALGESAERNQTKAFLETEGTFLMAKISYDETHTDSNSPAAFSVSNGIFIRTQNSVGIPLSDNAITVTSLNFTHSEPQAIRTALQISARSDNGQLLSQSFSGTSYIFP